MASLIVLIIVLLNSYEIRFDRKCLRYPCTPKEHPGIRFLSLLHALLLAYIGYRFFCIFQCILLILEEIRAFLFFLCCYIRDLVNQVMRNLWVMSYLLAYLSAQYIVHCCCWKLQIFSSKHPIQHKLMITNT